MTELTRASTRSARPGEPKYQWLKSVLIEHMDSSLTVGDPIPSERDLAAEFGMSRMTARRVLSDLVEEGRIERKVGLGTFVSSPSIRLPITLTSFTHDMTVRGMQAGSRILEFAREAPQPIVKQQLDLAPGAEIFRIVRLRLADGEPMALERVHLDASVAPELTAADLDDASLYDFLWRTESIVFASGTQTIQAKNLDADSAKLLGAEQGDAVLHLTRTSTWRGRKVEYTVSAYRADRYELSTEISSPQ